VRAPYTVSPQEGLEDTLDELGSDAVVRYNDGDSTTEAVELAESSDVTILMVGDVARETWDKNGNLDEENPGGNASGAPNEVPDLDLPSVTGTNQQLLIPRVLAANPNTIVVLKTQGQVNMPWIDDVDTLVEAWYPGQEDGNVVADALFGVTNFSAKLPLTVGRTDREAAYETQEQYPGYEEQTGKVKIVVYRGKKKVRTLTPLIKTGAANAVLAKSAPGKWRVVATYAGGDYYLAAKTAKRFTVKKRKCPPGWPGPGHPGGGQDDRGRLAFPA